MRNRLMPLFLALMILTFLPATALAQEFDPDQKGSISISLTSSSADVSMVGAEFSIYRVATVKLNEEGKLVYTYTDEFADCGFPLDDVVLAEKLDGLISQNNFPCHKIISDSQGKAVCADLPLGLYFVKQTGDVEGFATCASFLVTVPLLTGGDYVYQVDASPKMDVIRLIDITIRKVWNTDKATPGADFVTVQLLRLDTVVDTAVLNARNNWQVTFSGMPESDAYRILESNVPKGYTATYSQNGYVFTVTNTPSLAQTGQLVWPVPVLALTGTVLIMMGFVILRKPGKANA